jgi:hypothetical protein
MTLLPCRLAMRLACSLHTRMILRVSSCLPSSVVPHLYSALQVLLAQGLCIFLQLQPGADRCLTWFRKWGLLLRNFPLAALLQGALLSCTLG